MVTSSRVDMSVTDPRVSRDEGQCISRTPSGWAFVCCALVRLAKIRSREAHVVFPMDWRLERHSICVGLFVLVGCQVVFL